MGELLNLVGLSTGVGFLKGVGPYRADLLRKLGIIVARYFLPRVPRRVRAAARDRSLAMDGTGE